MKLLHIFDFFSPSGGGTVDVLHKIMKALAQRGHQVTLYTGDYKLDRAYIDSITGVDIRLFHCALSCGGFYYMPEIVTAVKNHLQDFDVIHLHCFRSYQNMVICREAARRNIPYIVDSHGSMPRKAAGETTPKWLLRWFFDIACGNRILEKSTKVVAQNAFVVKEYKKFGVPDEKIAMIPLFFPVEEFADLPKRGLFRKQYGLEGKKLVTSLGRIHRIKGLDFLVASFKKLASQREDAVLTIIGPDDGYRETLEKLVADLKLTDRVIFTGFLGGRDKLSALVDADVMVQPSRYEQAAWAPIEAVLCGTPVIVSRNSGAGEDVNRMNAGYLVDYGDTEQMVQTLQTILTDSTEAGDKTRKARDYITANMRLSKKIEDYENLYQACIQKITKPGIQ